MFRVEFIGLPGAGKSHIRENLVKGLKLADNERYITTEKAFIQASKTKIDRLYHFLIKCLPDNIGLKVANRLIDRSAVRFEAQNKFLARWGKAFETFLSSPGFDNMSIGDREIVISGFLGTGIIFERINGSLPENTVIFFEEGFVQKSFMFISHLIDYDENKSSLFSYLEYIPLPDLIIYVRADINTCYERMLYRQKGVTERLKGANREAILDFLKIADNHLKTVISWLKNKKNIHLMEIDNEDASETKVLENKIRMHFMNIKLNC
jgi:hypothetical protein